ncbi:MAG: NUDIX hydrolase [Thermoleophilia bacterium]|jgi:hypothetical protein|nr:NUDIX hydrolase [Thermoleophilia bacterium]
MSGAVPHGWRLIAREGAARVALPPAPGAGPVLLTRDVVHVLPVGRAGTVTLVRQDRWPCGRDVTEAPAGGIEPGEDPITAAARELAEETGLAAGGLAWLGGAATAPDLTDEVGHLVVATQATPAGGGGEGSVAVVRAGPGSPARDRAPLDARTVLLGLLARRMGLIAAPPLAAGEPAPGGGGRTPVRVGARTLIAGGPVRAERAEVTRDGVGRAKVVLTAPPVAVVLPLAPGGRVPLVPRDRPHLGGVLLEAPSAPIGPGERPPDAARAALDAAGMAGGRPQAMGAVLVAPGMTDRVAHLFLAPGARATRPRDVRDMQASDLVDWALAAARHGRVDQLTLLLALLAEARAAGPGLPGDGGRDRVPRRP